MAELPNPPSMGPLPIDIISNILARLPVKYLFRSKSVCKSWNSLISSKPFINLHLQLNSISSSDKLLLFSTNDHSLYSLTLDSLESPATKLSFFNNNDSSFSGFGGSCNGLILCFTNTGGSNSGVCLVNPSTLQYKMIPRLKVPKSYVCVNYGFGYDHIHDDYKVVRVINLVYGCEYSSVFNAREVMVYSLRDNSWKFVEEKISNYATLASRNGALVNNHLLHWVFWCISSNGHRISSFDVCSEQWGEVPMPCYVENRMEGVRDGECTKINVVHLGVLDGCLCLLTRNVRENPSNVDVWIMKEYGVKKLWVKLLNVSDLNVGKFLNVIPIDYSQNFEEILFRNEKELIVFRYDLRRRRSRNVEICGLQDYCGVTTCIRSIVPLNYEGEIDD